MPYLCIGNFIATASTSGKVVLWDAKKTAASWTMNQTNAYSDHARTVNSICWHPNDANLLLSGSQDGTVKVWDIRDKANTACTSFDGKADAVRSVRVSTFNYTQLAAGYEDGSVQLWDMRTTKRVLRIAAHQGLVVSVAWHPSERNLLASGGRDRSIKVWDLAADSSSAQFVPKYRVETIASVGKVAWRPHYRNHLV